MISSPLDVCSSVYGHLTLHIEWHTIEYWSVHIECTQLSTGFLARAVYSRVALFSAFTTTEVTPLGPTHSLPHQTESSALYYMHKAAKFSPDYMYIINCYTVMYMLRMYMIITLLYIRVYIVIHVQVLCTYKCTYMYMSNSIRQN